ncbi:3,4-dihydroxy-2-butanone-4-phosphate synthase [Novosphingobium sp. YAF33]|uniref:3,4-dihydroxy-2-butanone-4-phosphate synthase n=1 Tax=Novosphingobium sp. YAF33 TaxID=3233082 RepID=UPI003F9EB529
MTVATLTHTRPAALVGIEEIIEEARQGRMFILVDDEDRENEGDLVIPAQMATPEKINFMATHGRGLICLALSKARAEILGLELQTKNNGTRHETAFTTSIEARVGVTTGISAADRARTISVAINAFNGRDDIVTPGHVFPLVARVGGVLVRPGHTEAAVDVSRLAGLNASGVICEIMNDDGTMARFDDLMIFAARHDLKVGTIRDLIAYRRRHDSLVEKRSQTAFDSRWGGTWRAITFANRATGTEQVALVKGEIDPTRPTPVRLHAVSVLADLYGAGTGVGGLEQSMRMIAEEGRGILMPLRGELHPGSLHERGEQDAADYAMAAMILTELGAGQVSLLADSPHERAALGRYGIGIAEEQALPIARPVQ